MGGPKFFIKFLTVSDYLVNESVLWSALLQRQKNILFLFFCVLYSCAIYGIESHELCFNFLEGKRVSFVFNFSLSCQFSDGAGYVGFANLPNQVHRKSVKKGFEFTLMVVGKSLVQIFFFLTVKPVGKKKHIDKYVFLGSNLLAYRIKKLQTSVLYLVNSLFSNVKGNICSD